MTTNEILSRLNWDSPHLKSFQKLLSRYLELRATSADAKGEARYQYLKTERDLCDALSPLVPPGTSFNLRVDHDSHLFVIGLNRPNVKASALFDAVAAKLAATEGEGE